MSSARPGMEIDQSDSASASLLQKFKGTVATPSDAGAYDIKRYASDSERKAAYVVYPTDAADISVAILFAREEKLPIAISGGGHNVGGASSTEGGVVIDMRKMNAVRVDKEEKVGYIQGGTTVVRAAKELLKHGMATTLGGCGSVGCVGFATGGGLGFKMGQYGLGCDNIVSATMVLGSGEVITVDDKQHSDLLWGIKGGGSNFGVIVELGMRLHEARSDVCLMEHLYHTEQLPALVAELSAWLEVQTPQEFIWLGCVAFPGSSPEAATPYLIISGVADFSAEDGERQWGRFLKHSPVMSKVSQVPYDMYTARADEVVLLGTKVQGGTHFNKFDYDTVKRAYDMWLAVLPKAPFSIVAWEFYYYGLVETIPVEATAYPQRTPDKTALIGIYGYDEKWRVEAKQALADIQACVSSSSTEEAQKSFGYLNYSALATAENDKDVNARRVYGPNYPRLQRLKRKYDPDVVFNKWFCVRPADD